MKIAIFGGSGFIGSQVVKRLSELGYQYDLISHEKIDLFDFSAVNKFFTGNEYKWCIDLAWNCGKDYQKSIDNFDWVLATSNLARQFIQNGGRKLLIAGSVFEYDMSQRVLTEDSSLDCLTYYGKCKNMTHKIIDQYAQHFDVQVKWPRIFNLYGPNEKQNRLIPYIVNSIKQNRDIVLSKNKFQDYSYVKDTANAIVQLMISDIKGAVNICSGMTISLKEIAERLCVKFNYPISRISFNDTGSSAGDDFIVGDNSKLINDVKYNYMYNFDDGIGDYL